MKHILIKKRKYVLKTIWTNRNDGKKLKRNIKARKQKIMMMKFTKTKKK